MATSPAWRTRAPAGGSTVRRDVTRLAVADARSEDSSASILETLRPPEHCPEQRFVAGPSSGYETTTLTRSVHAHALPLAKVNAATSYVGRRALPRAALNPLPTAAVDTRGAAAASGGDRHRHPHDRRPHDRRPHDRHARHRQTRDVHPRSVRSRSVAIAIGAGVGTGAGGPEARHAAIIADDLHRIEGRFDTGRARKWP